MVLSVGVAYIWCAWFSIGVPGLVPSRIIFNETAAAGSLHLYVRMQERFRTRDRYGIGRKVYANPVDGAGFRDLYHIGHDGAAAPENPHPCLVDASLARADLALSEVRPSHGYVFANILGDAEGPYDYTRQHGLCAMPYEYGRSGRFMFIVNEAGRIYQKDACAARPSARAQPCPLITWPDVEKEGWLPVGE